MGHIADAANLSVTPAAPLRVSNHFYGVVNLVLQSRRQAMKIVCHLAVQDGITQQAIGNLALDRSPAKLAGGMVAVETIG